MSDIDPPPTNDPSPEPLAEGVDQSPAPETPKAATPGAEASPSDPAPEELPADISAEVDALMDEQGTPSNPEVATGPEMANESPPPS